MVDEKLKIEQSLSSTTIPRVDPSSTFNTEDNTFQTLLESPTMEKYMANYMDRHITPQIEEAKTQNKPLKRRTPTQWNALADFLSKVGVVIFVFLIIFVVTIAGAVVLITEPEQSKEVWVIIGPIISGAVSTMLTIFTFDKKKDK